MDKPGKMDLLDSFAGVGLPEIPGVAYTGPVDKTTPPPGAPTPLEVLEQDLGEPILYRATGRFLAARGLEAPLDVWGLIVLTPTRVVFRHFAQPHPLFGGKGEAVNFETPRGLFTGCQARVQGFWEKLFSGTPDHVALTGDGLLLALETADDQKAWAAAWGAP